MRKPTPVTTRIITDESGSSWKATAASKLPAVTHGKRTWTKSRSWAGRAARARTDRSDTMKEAPTTAGPRNETSLRYGGAAWWPAPWEPPPWGGAPGGG